MDKLTTSVFYDANGGPVPFNSDGTMSFFNTRMQSTTFGKYEPAEGNNRIKITMDKDNSIMYLRLAVDGNASRLYNSFDGLFASSSVHVPTRAEPTVNELRGENRIDEPLVPAMIVVHSIGDRSYDILCKRHWIWKDPDTKRMRFKPNGSVVELQGIYNTPTEVGGWAPGWLRAGCGSNAFYQPPGDWRNARKVRTNERICITFADGRRPIYMYVMVDPKDESLVYLQQERSAFKAIDDDTVMLMSEVNGLPACYAERVR